MFANNFAGWDTLTEEQQELAQEWFNHGFDEGWHEGHDEGLKEGGDKCRKLLKELINLDGA